MAAAEPPLLFPSPREGWPARAQRRVWADEVLFAIAVLALGLALGWQRAFFHDDAYVTLRYVARLLAGHGLTWNEGQRVEGFSSPLWLAQIALLQALHLPLPWAARGLGLAYAVAIVGLWRRMRAAPAGLLALVTIPGFALWTWGGLETIAGVFFTLLPAALLLRPSAQASRPWFTPATAVLALACACLQSQFTLRHRATPDLAAAMGEVVGRELAARLPAGTVVASATAGSIPYFAPSLTFIDTLGLNDRHIARSTPATAPLAALLDREESWAEVPGHMRGDGPYVLSRSPDVVILGGANGNLRPCFLGDYQLIVSSAFQRTYAPWRLLATVPPASQKWLADDLDAESSRLPLTLYVRRDSSAWEVIAKAGISLPPPWAAPR